MVEGLNLRAAHLYTSILVGALSCAAHAAPVSVANPSFESPALSGANAFTTVAPAGWTSTGGSSGVWLPSITGYAAPDGVQVAYSNGSVLSQTLADVLTANTEYTLTVSVGLRPGIPAPGYEVTLLAGSTVLGTVNQSSVSLVSGHFVPVQVAYFAVAGDSLIGQALEIRLGSSAAQVNFDAVSLDARLIQAPGETAVPLPAALPLFASALGLSALLRRRKNSAAS